MSSPNQSSQGRLPFNRALGLIPVLVALHNAEEYPRIVPYARRHGVQIGKTQMLVAVLLVTLLPIPITARATRGASASWDRILSLAVPAALFVNALGHLGQTLWLRDYWPGTITGIGLNAPFALYLYRRAAAEGYLSTRQLAVAAALGAALMAPVALVAQTVGMVTSRWLRRGP